MSFNIDSKDSKIEKFLLENRKSLSVIGGVFLALTLLFVWYLYVYTPSKEKEALNQMFRAEQYFAENSFQQAIEGDGSYPGFKKIIEDYGNTKSGNLAQYYLGICYLKIGQYEQSIEHLTSFSSSDLLLSTLALGATGDAYSELKNYEKAIVFYKKASDRNKNDFTSALYLKKLGLVYEETKNHKDALEVYNTIKNDYSASTEARDIEIYIARVVALDSL